MSMSKRDYQAIARAIHGSRFGLCAEGSDCDEHPSQEPQWRAVTNAIADVLAADNPRFSRALFIEACETGRCKGMPR